MNLSPGGRLRIDVAREGQAFVVRPVGELDLVSYPRLRDALLKASAEQPSGIVVALSGLTVENAAVLSVFTTVWMRITEWPGIPLVLAGPTPAVWALLRRTGVSRFVTAYPDLRSATAALETPPARRQVRRQLSADSRCAFQARRVVDDVCLAWDLASFGERARLIASELVSNALQHGGSAPDLRLEWNGRHLVVAVGDASPQPPRVLDPSPTAAFGRGLRLVAQAANCWGYTPTAEGGKVVWASLRPLDRHRRS